MRHLRDLAGAIRSRLETEGLLPPEGEVCEPEPRDYDVAFERALERAKAAANHMEYSQVVVAERYRDIFDVPEMQRELLLRNASPDFLVVLLRALLSESYERRFDDPRRTRSLATAASDVADLVLGSDYLTRQDRADLVAEARAHLSNAHRILGDLQASRSCEEDAWHYFSLGTKDRSLKADLLKFQATRLSQEGYCSKAAEILSREVNLRRLLGDQTALGAALINSGWAECWSGDIKKACRFLREGTSLVEDPAMLLIALHTLAERFARDGDGWSALKLLATASVPLHVVDNPRFVTRQLWFTALANRALGDNREAIKGLEVVVERLRDEGTELPATTASLDLACALIAEGETAKAKALATYAWTVFKEQRVAAPMLVALQTLRTAFEREKATVELAGRVTGFLARYSRDRDARLRLWECDAQTR